jgi:Acyl-CoA carboxylase epsilon subunit
VERLTGGPRLRVVRGAPDPGETAALLAVLATVLGAAGAGSGTGAATPATPARPTWLPFAGHAPGGWGRP